MAQPSPSGNPVLPAPDLRRVLLIDIALPFLAIFLLERNGVAALPAYAIGSLFPLGSIVLLWLRQRRIDVIGIIVVLGIASGLMLGHLSNDARFGLLRAAPVFALFGLACLGSLLTARPLMFFVARAFAPGGPERNAAWNERLALPPFRRVMRLLTLVWGMSALIEASLAGSAAFLLPERAALVTEPLIAFGTVAALLAWTRAQQRRAPPIAPSVITFSPINPPEEQRHA